MWSPYVELLKNNSLETILIHSGQHDTLGLQAQKTFNITPDYYCSLIDDDKLKLGDLVSKLISEFTKAFYKILPDLILVHGDTTTAFSASVAAFLQNITIGHIEAGLRTSRFEYPFPEEGYRRAISRFTTLHFAPTPKSARNLHEENIHKNVYICGNTVVDALNHINHTPDSMELRKIRDFIGINKMILVTCHRRESYGEPLINLCNSLKNIANNNKYVNIVWPVHNNPRIYDTVKNLEHEKILLVEPQDYNNFIKLLHMADIIITDSGGVMEESAVIGKPTLVLRSETERPEALELDSVRLVAFIFNELEDLVNRWLINPPKSEPSNIFGMGDSGIEIAEIINKYFMEKHGN